MPYRTAFGKHYHMRIGCCTAIIPCDTKGLEPCAICCGSGNGSSNGGGVGGQGGQGGQGGSGGQGGQTTATQVFHDDLARGMSVASAGVDAIRHSKALPLAIDVATIAATIALGSALLAGTAFGAIASHRRARKLPEGTFQMLSNGAHAIAGIVTVAGKGLETLRQKAPLS